MGENRVERPVVRTRYLHFTKRFFWSNCMACHSFWNPHWPAFGFSYFLSCPVQIIWLSNLQLNCCLFRLKARVVQLDCSLVKVNWIKARKKINLDEDCRNNLTGACNLVDNSTLNCDNSTVTWLFYTLNYIIILFYICVLQMLFQIDNRSEWLYRGSTRLGPLFSALVCPCMFLC